jgi:hypothetical protein
MGVWVNGCHIIQHTTYSIQHTAFSIQHTIYNIQLHPHLTLVQFKCHHVALHAQNHSDAADVARHQLV